MSTGSVGNKQHKLKVSQLLADLQSENEGKITDAIKSFHVHGDASIIDPLIHRWKEGLSTANEAAIMELFEGLKDTSTVQPLMGAFRNLDNALIERKLVAAFWSSKLDFSAFLSDFVLFAIEGDFLDAFEAITLIEQFDSMIPESAIMESQLLLKEYFGGTEERDPQKDAILSDLAILVKQFDEETDSEDLFLD